MGVVTYAKLGVVGMIGSVAAVSYADRAINYVPTNAIVTEAVTDCFVKRGKDSIVKKGTKEMAYLDCGEAKLVVGLFGFTEKDIKKRSKLKYKYKSPVDGSTQVGTHEDEYSRDGFKVGQKVQIYAHTSEAKYSRWL